MFDMKRIIPILILVILISSLVLLTSGGQAWAQRKHYGDVEISQVTSIYDGDTFRCNIPNWPPIIGHRISVRINGIDTPEMRDPRPEIRELARQAKMFTVGKLRAAKKIELRNIKRGKYFRIIADVYVDGFSLARMLLNAGLAKSYHGGKKPKW